MRQSTVVFERIAGGFLHEGAHESWRRLRMHVRTNGYTARSTLRWILTERLLPRCWKLSRRSLCPQSVGLPVPCLATVQSGSSCWSCPFSRKHPAASGGAVCLGGIARSKPRACGRPCSWRGFVLKDLVEKFGEHMVDQVLAEVHTPVAETVGLFQMASCVGWRQGWC